mmetsp:Transcript_53007/g.113295  ORF Transcript_53007/g.113295 Transcript_53007/m.113295 type:complete len:231 (-) Transcript_53007:417-1109(-)
MHLLHALLLLLPLGTSSSYGDCSCSCCAKAHPLAECTPQLVGFNTLKSCSSCSAAYCAHQWPTVCPSAPDSGGKYNFGGHASFACDGWVDDVEHTAEGGGGVAVILMLVLFALLCVSKRQQHETCAHAPVPMGQPLDQYPCAQPVAGTYMPPPTVIVQPAHTARPDMGATEFAAGAMVGAASAVVGGMILGGHHGGGHHGGGHHGGGHHGGRHHGGGGGGGHATHSAGGF